MGYDLSGIAWRKSSHSSANGQCVEIGDGLPGAVPVRDSKHPAGPRLIVGAGAWGTFIETLKTDDPTAF